jgi:threonine synthase
MRFMKVLAIFSKNAISKSPKMVAVEPIDRLSGVLEGEDYHRKFPGEYQETISIGGHTTTFHSVYAIQKSKGFAITISPKMAIDDIIRFAKDGYYLESSSATVYQTLETLKRTQDTTGKTVVTILTSHGFSS